MIQFSTPKEYHAGQLLWLHTKLATKRGESSIDLVVEILEVRGDKVEVLFHADRTCFWVNKNELMEKRVEVKQSW